MINKNEKNDPKNNEIKPKSSSSKKPKMNMTYFYIALIALVLGFNFFTGKKIAVETTWHEVKNTMIKNDDVEKIVVLNKTEANIYLKSDKLEKYAEKMGKGYNKPSNLGPHFSFVIGSVDKFEENLDKAYQEFNIEATAPIIYDDTYDWTGLLSFLFPIALIIFFWWFIFRRMAKGAGGGPGGNIFSVGKSQAKTVR
jgi:AFG3 family protein